MKEHEYSTPSTPPSSGLVEKNYKKTLKILTQQERPSAVLCTLMNWLESYRQSRKMGWSRAWNKYGLTTFQSFKVHAKNDQDILLQGFQLLDKIPQVPTQARPFIQSLRQEDNIMAFLFFSEYQEQGQYYESVTLSLGRKVKDQARFRDRLDLVFDARIRNNQVQKLDRLRIYIDPFQTDQKEPLWQLKIEGGWPVHVQETFAHLCELSWTWEEKTEKHWQHWTSQYIDYFGTRSFDLDESFLHHPHAQRAYVETTCIT